MRTVLLRADATRDIGVGHTMRLLALAQEFQLKGVQPVLVGALDVPFVAEAYRSSGVPQMDAPLTASGMVALARRHDAEAVVLDGYEIPASWGSELRAAGVPVMAMVDSEFGAAQDADLYVDQNPGTSPRSTGADQHALAGAEYTLFRDDILELRRDLSAIQPNADDALRVLAVFGGTDPLGAAPVIAPLILETGLPLDLTVISAESTWANDLIADLRPGQSLTVTSAPSSLAALASASDFVVTASGSSVWEMLCQGVPIGVVCVIDNQQPGYDWVTGHGYGVPVGHLETLRVDDAARTRAVQELRSALSDESARVRQALQGQALLDGRGRERVASAVLQLGKSRRTSGDN